MKNFIFIFMIFILSISAYASEGKVKVTDMNYGIRDVIITGDAAQTLYETLKKSAGNGVIKDGKGINCYKENSNIYCVLPVNEEGVLDLYDIPTQP